MKPSKPEPLLTEREAATHLNFSPRTLAGWRYRGGGPPYVSVSSTAVRYRRRDLDKWIETRVRWSTSDCGDQGEQHAG
jgi:predicted DNA-binding transcriptional regulator AlpA